MATRRITIDPVTRLEGHARVTIDLGDDGVVRDARMHVTQFRGFEAFCEGRPFHEMPSLMARICGICPVSHLIASAKACDALLAVRIPDTAADLRRVLNLAQTIQSHALSFFHLSSPDLLLGLDAPVAQRNLFGVLGAEPALAKDGIRLRQIGQQIIEILAGERIHPGWVVPGGVNRPLDAERRDRVLALLPDALAIAERTLDRFRGITAKFTEEIETFANFPTLFLGLVTPEGHLEFYDGTLRIMDSAGNIIADRIDPAGYATHIAEAVEPGTYLKSPYYKPMGYPDGIYRVGPLARLNIAHRAGTPRADLALAGFRERHGRPAQSSFHYHEARLIEVIHAVERIGDLLERPTILDTRVRADARPNEAEGIGVAEAPRGTLIHHYRTDADGRMTFANLIIATGHNHLAMNRGLLQVARHFVHGPEIPEGALNRVEAVLRTFDPCLSCSTHALGAMPLDVEVRDLRGAIVARARRG